MKPGDTIINSNNGERRTIVEIKVDDPIMGSADVIDEDGKVRIATVRRADDDPLREFNEDGSDKIFAEYLRDLRPA